MHIAPDHTERVAVCYDFGAASVGEIVQAVSDPRELLFVVDTTSSHYPVIEEVLGEVGVECIDLARLGTAGVADEVRRRGAVGVTTFAEPMLQAAAEIANFAGFDFHSPVTTARLCSKIQQRQALNDAGVSVTRFAVMERAGSRADLLGACRRVGAPVVVKPEYGGGSRDTHLIAKAADVERIWPLLSRARSGRMIVEEYLRGYPHPVHPDWLADYVSVEVAAFRGEYRLMCVTDKPPLIPPLREGGALEPSTLPPVVQQRLFALSCRALAALGVTHGVSHCELKLGGDGPDRVIEVNGRLGGPVHTLLTRVSNLNPIRIGLDIARGVRPAIDSKFHGYAVRADILAPVGATRVTALPTNTEVRRIPQAYKVQSFVTAPASVDPYSGESGKVMSVWLTDPMATDLADALSNLRTMLAETATFS
jgi:biotin carboxylase